MSFIEVCYAHSMSRDIIILGTARSDGNTRLLVDAVNQPLNAQIIDLNEYQLSHYNYEDESGGDDFKGLAELMLSHQNIIFATPVYWYAMSTPMKVFFDRFSDLLKAHKGIGKGLSGKATWLLSSGTEPCLPEGFEVPFSRTSDYFDMQYKGSFYFHVTQDSILDSPTKERAIDFGKRILE